MTSITEFVSLNLDQIAEIPQQYGSISDQAVELTTARTPTARAVAAMAILQSASTDAYVQAFPFVVASVRGRIL